LVKEITSGHHSKRNNYKVGKLEEFMKRDVGLVIFLSLTVVLILVLGSFAAGTQVSDSSAEDTIDYSSYDSGDVCDENSYYYDWCECNYPGDPNCGYYDDSYDYVCTIDADYSEYGVCPEENIIGGTDAYECIDDGFGYGEWSDYLCEDEDDSDTYEDSYDLDCYNDEEYYWNNQEYCDWVFEYDLYVPALNDDEVLDEVGDTGVCYDDEGYMYFVDEGWGLCEDFVSPAYTCKDYGNGYIDWSDYLCEDDVDSGIESIEEEILNEGCFYEEKNYAVDDVWYDLPCSDESEHTWTCVGNDFWEDNDECAYVDENSILDSINDKSFEEIDQEMRLDESKNKNASDFILSIGGVERLAKETLNKLASAIVPPDVKSVVDMNKIKEYQSSVIENARQDARTKKNDPANLVINGKPLYTYSYSELTAMFDGLPLSTRESIIRYYDNWQMVLEIQNEPEYKDYVSSMQDYLETFNSLSPEEQKQLKSLISSEGNQFLTNLREKLIPYELNDIKRLGDLSGINPVAEVEEVNKNKIDYVYERLIPLMMGKIESASSKGYSPENVNEMNSLLDTILIWSKPYSQTESMETSFQTELGSMSSYPLSGIVDWAQNNYDQLIKTEDGKLLLGRLYGMGAQLSPPLNDVQQTIKKLTDKGFIDGLTSILGLALPKIITPKYDVQTGGEFIIDQEPLNYDGQIISSTDYMKASNVKDEKGNNVGFIISIPPSSEAVADLGVSSSKVDFDDL